MWGCMMSFMHTWSLANYRMETPNEGGVDNMYTYIWLKHHCCVEEGRALPSKAPNMVGLPTACRDTTSRRYGQPCTWPAVDTASLRHGQP